MEISLPKTLLDGISRFRLLSSNNNVKAELAQRYRRNIDEILELLKPVFDEAVGSEIVSDERLNKVLEELDSVVNEATELVGSWHQMMSKVYFVLQIESVIIRIQTSALGTCWLLDSLSPSPIVNSTFACTEHRIQKIQHMLYEQISDVIEEAIRCQIDKVIPASEHLEKISNSLSLSSNQELLTEVVALEKLKAEVSRGENYVEVENIDHMIALVNHMHDCFVKSNQLHSINGVQIPADFCCPLSLELMSDPVIVESGQTYERVFIRKWLDEGFNVCPKTRQTLGHSNLISNYTVKALIANWCESNDIKLPDPIASMSVNLASTFLSPTDLSANDCKIPQSGHSLRTNHPRLSQSNRFTINSHKDSFSSNGVHQETYQQDIPKSPNHHSLSIGSILHTPNGCEANMAKTSIAGVEKKKESSLEERHVDSGAQISNQSKRNFCQPPEVDEQFQDHNQSVCAVSSSDYPQGAGDVNIVSRVSSDLTYYSSNASGEVTQEAPVSSAPQREPELPPRVTEGQSRSQTIWHRPSERFVPRIVSSRTMDSRPDLSGVETQVAKLLEDLKSDAVDVQRAATEELRLLAKHNTENRIIIANSGAIILLVGLLHSTDLKTQENAVTTLLNLSLNVNNKTAIVNADAIDPLIHVLETGNPDAKENSAATLFSLSVIEENKVKIGRSGAIRPLVELLGNGTPCGKKDAATALYNLSTFHENRARIVQAGAVRHFVDLMDPAAGMVDKAVAVLANLATIPEGRSAIGHEGGIPVLVEVVELGSARGKETAAAALLHLCMNSNRFCSLVLQEGAVPPLVALSQSGTPRAKEKAQNLLSHFRNQRQGNAGRA